MKFRHSILAGLAALATTAAPQMALADSASCAAGGCSAGPLSVTFSVTIPAFLRFQLGAVGSNPDVQFNTGVTAANAGSGTAVSADTVVNGGTGSNGTDQVLYVLLSNLGGTNVQVSAAGVGAGLVSGTDTIPYSEIGATTTVTTGSGLAMPAAGGSTTVTPSGGVINERGFWNYTFGNASIYPSGTYTGTIQYTATHTP